ncbi:hypothetical protein WDW89_11990, partial [Deltaproteobacteria bacterium TL4]
LLYYLQKKMSAMIESERKIVRRVYPADDPLVKILIVKYTQSDQLKGVRTTYKQEENKRVIDTIELFIQE